MMSTEERVRILKARRNIAAALTLLIGYLSGCAARTAQQEIDTRKEHAIAILKASEFIRFDRLERNSKCRGAHATFAKLILPPLETNIVVAARSSPTLNFGRFSTISGTPT